MPISLNHLADELINWCASEIPRATNYYWHDENHLMEDFARYLNEKTNISASKGIPRIENSGNNHLFMLENGEQTNKGIIAEFLYDRNKKVNNIEEQLDNSSVKFSKKNIDVSFQSSIRCIVGFYNDLNNRRTFHEEEFIEVFNDFGVGCAIKRLQ